MTRLLLASIAMLVVHTSEAVMGNEGIYRLPQQGDAERACLRQILLARRTMRSFSPGSLSLPQVAELLWAAQGVSSPEGYRTAPSAGALYPLELHLVAGNVQGLPAGSYRYDPAGQTLKATIPGDLRRAVAESALNQLWIARAPAILVISAVESRTTAKYGRRGVRYVHMEVGHASQNVLLQAVDLGLAGAVVGAFDDDRLKLLLRLTGGERPVVILPVGHPVNETSSQP